MIQIEGAPLSGTYKEDKSTKVIKNGIKRVRDEDKEVIIPVEFHY
jgi:hypothetical protein